VQDPASPVEETPGSPPRWRLWRPRRHDLLPLALVALVIAASAAFVIGGERHFGPIDEFQHYDYITEIVYHHRIPVPGDTFTQEAMRAHACHPGQSATRQPPCDSASFSPSDFETGGQATTGGYPPAYYVPTALVAWGISTVTRASDLFIAARIASVLWLVLGAALTYLLARSFAAGRWLAAGVALLAALAPMMLYQGSTVNPDSMSLLAGAGAAAAWLSLRASARWRHVVILCLVLAGIALIKPNFLAVPIAVALAEIALAARGGARSLATRTTWSLGSPTTRVCLAAVGASLLGVAWPFYFRLVRGTASALVPGTPAFSAARWNTEIAFRGWANSLAPLAGLPKAFDRGWFVLLSALVDALVISGVVAAVLMSRRRELQEDLVSSRGAAPLDPLRALGYLGAASLVVAAPVMYVVVAASRAFIIYPPRYSLFIVPIGLVALVGLSASPGSAARYLRERDRPRQSIDAPDT
jgi:hypothetical protein